MHALLSRIFSCPTWTGHTKAAQGTEGWYPAAGRLVWKHKDPKVLVSYTAVINVTTSPHRGRIN